MDSRYLRQALDQAEVRRGQTCPNPAVGAVLVREGEVVGVGYHWGAGFPHAEVRAVEASAGKAIGATLYVTLEPCCHTDKRTPPCTKLIRESGITRVVYGYRDPNPKVSGNGEAALKEAGIACEYLPLPEIEKFYEGYRRWTLTARPQVTAKIAVSLDGKIAGPNGARVALTGEEAAKVTHAGRKRADAILTTVRTVRNDDPRLDARVESGEVPKPVFVLDRRAELPLDAKVWKTAKGLVVLHGEEAPAENVAKLSGQGATLIQIGLDESGLDLNDALAAVGKLGFHTLWVEAGGRLFQSLLQKRLLSRALVYVAPVLVGEGTSAFSISSSALSGAKSVSWSTAGRDTVGEFELEE